MFSCSPDCPGRTGLGWGSEGRSGHLFLEAVVVPILIALNGVCVLAVWLMSKGSVLMKW